MDSFNTASQFTFNHGRTASQCTGDRQLSESSNNHTRQTIHSPILESRPSYRNRQSLDSTQSEQRVHRPTTSPTTPFHHLTKLAASSPLHFDYRHARYPSPPSTQGTFPILSSNSQAFAYPSSSSAQRSPRDRPPNDRRRGDASPPRHPSPPLNLNLHRANGSSSSASTIALPPLSTHLPPILREVDQPQNHQHLESSTMRRKPSITDLSRDHPEQAPSRRHTLDSNHVPDPQMVSGARQRTLSTLPSPSYPAQFHHSSGTQQVPSSPQPGQTRLTSRRYSSPAPPTHRHDNPPTLARPPSPSTSQPPQRSPSPQSLSQPATTDGSSSVTVTSIEEAADIALEPLRLGFENVWTQTVQNVRQVMGKMQKDLIRLNSAERRKNANLMRCLVSSSEKLKAQEWAVEELRKEKSSLMEKVLQNEQLRRENNQKITVIDSLKRESRDLRRDNEELREKNEEVKEALTRATEFIFQYKEELAKVKADAETFRKCREASMLSTNDPTMTTSDLQREITRLHAEKERERIFNDAVKQLRALTALEGLTTTRGCDSEKTVVTLSNILDDCRTVSSREVSTSKQNPSLPPVVAQVHRTVDERPRLLSTSPSPTQAVSSDNEEKTKVEVDESDSHAIEIIDVEMDDDNVAIVPPTIDIQTTTPNPQEAEQDNQLTDGPRNSKELEPPSDLEMQRQRRREARRGPTPPTPSTSSPQTGSRKTPPAVSKTGMKRDRKQYEEEQAVNEQDQDVGMDNPDIVLQGEQSQEGPVHGRISAETEAISTDLDNSEEEGQIVILERKQKADMSKSRRKGKKVSTDRKQVTPHMEVQSQEAIFPIANNPNPKTLGRWAYYTHYRDSVGVFTPSPRSFVTQPSTTPPSPQARLPKKLGINHMDLLYKTEREVMVCRICLSIEQNSDATAAERRKAKANTKKFPLNASWADLINHCQTEHSKACEDMEKLSPSQLAEMKQRTR